MRRTAVLAFLLGLAIVIGASDASAEGGKLRLSHFFNYEWFRDADGDGIPNCLDDDWTRPQDGTGYQDKHGAGSGSSSAMPGSPEGQGISQNRYRHGSGNGQGPGNGSGSGDQTRAWLRLRDGSCAK